MGALVARPGTVDGILARMVEPYLHWIARSSEWAWTDPRGRFVDGSHIDPRLESLTRRGQPVILSYYIADALGVATLGLMHVEFRRLMRGLRCLVDDTVAGRVSGAMIEHLGGRFALLPRPGDPDRLRGVHGVIRSGGSCAFPVDGGGPYRQVGTGIIGLAASLNAVIVPFAVRVTPAIVFAPQSRVRVPMPRCRAVAAMGDEIRVARGGDRRATAAVLKDALDQLSVAVHHPS
ncbi:MAG: hypothetical protein ABIR79_09355 [Candidatus Binatia bacterium]